MHTTIPQVKKDIEFNKGLFSLLEVLKMIAVSQFRAFEQRLKSFEKLVDALEGFFEMIDAKNIRHPFLNPEGNSQVMIAVTSDVGLLGGLNIKILDTALAELEKAERWTLAVVGERGQTYAYEKGFKFEGFKGISEQERFSQSIKLRDWAIDKLLNEGYGSVVIVYPRALSITLQRVERVSLLPYTVPERDAENQAGIARAGIIEESSVEDIITYLISLWLARRFYEIFGMSRLAEFAARFIHLEESSQRLRDMQEALKHRYFRMRHEVIDRSMRELFSARSLYARR